MFDIAAGSSRGPRCQIPLPDRGAVLRVRAGGVVVEPDVTVDGARARGSSKPGHGWRDPDSRFRRGSAPLSSVKRRSCTHAQRAPSARGRSPSRTAPSVDALLSSLPSALPATFALGKLKRHRQDGADDAIYQVLRSTQRRSEWRPPVGSIPLGVPAGSVGRSDPVVVPVALPIWSTGGQHPGKVLRMASN